MEDTVAALAIVAVPAAQWVAWAPSNQKLGATAVLKRGTPEVQVAVTCVAEFTVTEVASTPAYVALAVKSAVKKLAPVMTSEFPLIDTAVNEGRLVDV
jgi:hypothetical protein